VNGQGAEMDRDGEDVGGYSLYEDIINEVMAGRVDGHKCPSCGDGELECTVDEARLLVSCPKCGRYFEGMLA